MAGSNSNFQLLGTDFNQIKSNLITYFRDQEVLNDANYTGSVLSMLMDILAYNTHYNAYYLNMVGNEMFLDTATRRSSVVSHAKVLGYYPRSRSCPTAVVDIDINQLESSSFYMPKFTKFLSEKVDDTNHTFVTVEEYFVSTDESNNIKIENVILKQGEPVNFIFNYDAKTNPNALFKIPETNIDLDTLEVIVRRSSTDVSTSVFNKVGDTLALDEESEVYFIQESLDGFYEIYFGNGIVGKKLTDGNIIFLSYLVTAGIDANGAKNFDIIDTLASYNLLTVTTKSSASLGSAKENVDSIKYIAPKYFSSQGRAVTTSDYITQIRKNSTSFPVDSVNVWGGETNDPPIYGKVFVSVKPKGGFSVTQNQKELIKELIVKPLNVITIDVEIVDVDYTFLTLETNILIDKSKTTLTESELKSTISDKIEQYADSNLNSFESTLSLPDVTSEINNSNPSVITNEETIKLQKRFIPTLNSAVSYNFDFGFPIKRDFFNKSISIVDSYQAIDTNANFIVRENVYIEEVPASSTTIQSIQIINPGLNYTKVPTIQIIGDGKNATARAEIVNGKIRNIIVDNPGEGYTQAIAKIIDGGEGILGSARVILQGQYGLLRSYYYNNGIKYILNKNIGTVDYLNGLITLKDFNPYKINNAVGELRINVIPNTSIIYSTKNKLLTLDPNDLKAISINLRTK